MSEAVNGDQFSTEHAAEESYKKYIILAIVICFIGVAGFGISHYIGSESERKHTSRLYDFTKTDLDAFSQKKINEKELVSKLKELFNEVSGHNGFVPVALSAVNQFDERKLNKEALEITDLVYNEYHSKNAYLHFFTATHFAKQLEDAGKFDRAIEVLDKLSKSENKIMQGKVYLDLGRLYKRTNKIELAKKNFQFTIDMKKGGEFEKLAKLYLEQI